MNAKGMMHRIVGVTLVAFSGLSADLAFAQVPGDGIPDIYYWTAGAGGVSIPTSAGNQSRGEGTILVDTDGLFMVGVIIGNNQELATPLECILCPGDTLQGFPVLAGESGEQSQWGFLIIVGDGPTGVIDFTVSQDPANLQFLPQAAFNNLPVEYRTPGSVDIFHLDVTLVTAADMCGNGVIEGTEECDDGNTDDGDCCEFDCTFELEGSACGDPGDSLCDNPDTCDGAGMCQPNHEDIFALCRLADGECDALEFCDGAGNCPPDAPKPAGAPCGDPTDTDCDSADTCDGAGVCQENIQPAGTACGDAGDTDCDNPDTCDGAGTCQDNNEPDDMPCPDGLFCNGEETCLAGACMDNADPCIPLEQRCDEDDDVCIELERLDIKPGSCPNSVNRSSQGVVPMALVGSDTFDVFDVDLSSLVLSRADGVGGGVTPIEGPPGPHTVVDDVATPFHGDLCDCDDFGGDGFDDLSMKFRTPGLADALELDEFFHGEEVELVLSGELLDGTRFEASDCVVVKGRNGPNNNKMGRMNPRP